MIYTDESHSKLIKDILSTEDYYEILNVTKSSSEEEIKKAYKKVKYPIYAACPSTTPG